MRERGDDVDLGGFVSRENLGRVGGGNKSEYII